ncbi:MAG: FAD:protein FMN transferase [Formosimonas sp.]
MQTLSFYAMGTHMSVYVDVEQSQTVDAALAQVPQWFAGWANTFSRFRADSELMQLNAQSTGQWLAVSADFWVVLQLALHAAQHSSGVLTPLVHDALLNMGYRQSFDVLRHTNVENVDCAASVTHLKVPDWREIECDAAGQKVRLPHGASLDLGGFVKGWCADEVVRRLSSYGPALMDAGGDIAISGALQDGSAWAIDIAAPRDSNRMAADLMTIWLKGGGIATSGRDYRQWRQGEHMRHHLIDAHSGQSAHTDVLTATVIAPNAQRAEAVAKMLVILGSQRGQEYLRQQADCTGCMVLQDRRVWLDKRFSKYVLPEKA